ncbi:MAG: endonuclease Q family protein [Candidatus Omnitrophica bacterium]|nr:endonuclease Q family protein [Candidatus Omnitrophota bacterium]
MKFVADLHIHSKYSRAASKDMEIPYLSNWAKLKGVDLLASGDFTHPGWLGELKEYLIPIEETGLFSYNGVKFILSAEVSNIFTQNQRNYRVHNIILAPTFKVIEEVNQMLSGYGNLAADGRPVLGGLSCESLAKKLFEISEDIMVIPAHIWTPWFSLFGSKSGFDSIKEAFGKYSGKITALETGLSSDPPMNWRVSDLDKYSLVSNSDSHSLSRLGREANVFDCELNYWEIKKVLEQKDRTKFLYTIEFFPEEGKYYYDGHRNCGVRFAPYETRENSGICPACNRTLTKGVLHRVDELADRDLEFVPEKAIGYKHFVSLEEIIAQARGFKASSKKVKKEYLEIVGRYQSEFNVLNNVSYKELIKTIPEAIVQGIQQVRDRNISISPGYDGKYGTIKIGNQPAIREKRKQLVLF